MSRIREEYIASGQVRFVYKHFAILGPESNQAAEASECAAEQEKFWDFHDLTFADQVASRSSLSAEKLTELAAEIGLDTDAFSECLASGRYTSQISQESLSVQSMGVRGTPAFLINGVFVSGAQPFEVFQEIIDEQLDAGQAVEDSEDTAEEPPEPVAPTPSPNPIPPAEEAASPEEEIEGVVFFPEQSQDHHEGEIEYDQEAPPGGAHSDEWQNCGIYDEPLSKEPVVHSLEHGAVWIAYQTDLPGDQVKTLRTLTRQALQSGLEPLVLLSPEPDLEAPIVATAWQVQLSLDDANDERLVQFLDRYQNGPFTPEPGAPCSGGVGEPLE